jgi:hypothetical protein
VLLCRAESCAQIKRTEGVSTTDIVGRMLTCTRPTSFREHAEKVRPPTRERRGLGWQAGTES